MINYEIKFLTCNEALQVKNCDFKSFKYETKKRLDESVFDSGKKSYCERRGGLWRTAHPRQARKLESKLREKNIVKCEWSTETLITIVFSSGVIAYLTVKPMSLDVTQILFDRYFVGKISGQTITNVAFCKSLILLVHNDHTATLVTFGKSNVNIPCRISDRDPHLQNIELGGSGRRTERYISLNENSTGTNVLVWSVNVIEPAPWSPIIADQANLHLYNINNHDIKLVAYHQLENETLLADLSYSGDNIIHIVQQVILQKNGIHLEWLRYNMNKTDGHTTKLSCSRDSATNVSIPTSARLVRRSSCDTRLLVACIDGTLHIVHCVAGIVQSTKAGFIATEIYWAGELIIAVEEGGRIQCFDRALSLLHHHSKCLELSSYLRDSRRMQILATRTLRNGPMLLLTFSGGPLTLMHITHPRLITAWIRMKQPLNGVKLLSAMDWEREGTECLWAMNRLVCSALRNKSAEEPVAEGALGTFLAPPAPLTARAARYAPPVHDLARKFFHHLLRGGRTEKALSLAVDLAAWDLFADARWAARRRRQHALALEAAHLALGHAHAHGHGHTRDDSECSGSCSGCSSHSYSESEDESSRTEDLTKSKPAAPPLPRVSMPQLPTMMQVPIIQPEPSSTNSIRPNLHQYLERDNTIWTTDIRDNYSRDYEHEYPKRNTQNIRWNSIDMLPNYRPIKHALTTIKESPVKNNIIEVIPRPHDERINSHFKHLYQTELSKEISDKSNTLYRYQNNNIYQPSTSVKERSSRAERELSERLINRAGERNKVKFSDTVTVAVVSRVDQEAEGEAARELAASLPLCAPHKYLAAFTPQLQHNVQQNGLHQHNVQQHNMLVPQNVQLEPAVNAPPKPLKIKVVHFGMV